jgi:hypothetical protein
MMNRPMCVAGWMLAAMALLSPFCAEAGEPCEAWMASLVDYDAAFERVMRGEPEDLLRLIREARDPGAKAQAGKKAGEKLAGLRGITPPPELASLHGRLIAYAQAVADAVAAASPADTSVDKPAPRPCYESLLGYYREMRSLLRKHGCRGGDVDALDQRIIPKLEEYLSQGAAAVEVAP